MNIKCNGQLYICSSAKASDKDKAVKASIYNNGNIIQFMIRLFIFHRWVYSAMPAEYEPMLL